MMARTTALLLGLLIGLRAVAHLVENVWPGRQDQSAYLALGLAAREGTFPWDGTRGPLYPWLIAPLARADEVYFDEAYFVAAKALSAGMLVSAVALAAALAGRWAGPEAGLALALALALQDAVFANGTLATAEGLLSLLFVGVSAAAARGRWPTAGGLLGLAYLAKTSALLGLPALALAAWRYAGRRAAMGAVAAFVLSASPLLLHNTATRGDPLYSWPSRHALWMDSWSDALAGHEPTWRSYIATHSPLDAARRLLRGIDEEARTEAAALIAAFLGLLALRRSAPLEARRAAAFVLPTTAIFFVLFAWYPVRSARFLLPLRAPLWAIAVLALSYLPHSARRALLPAVAFIAAGASVAVVPRVGPVEALHPDLRAVLEWRSAAGVAWSEIAYDAHDEFLPGEWLVPTPGILAMEADPWTSAARCLVATRHAVYMRQEAFAPGVRLVLVDGKARLEVGSLPAGWRPVLIRPSVAVLCRSMRSR